MRRAVLAAALLSTVCAGTAFAQSQGAFIFGSRDLAVPNPNNPGTDYTMVLHQNSPAGYDAIQYDAARGWGFEVINPGATGRNTSERFGPFDDSPNGRNNFEDIIPDELYDSFIGFKSHPSECSAATIGDGSTPCSPTIPPSGGIFRVDVPNGQYRFNAIIGEADNNHAHRVLVENGGSGGPDSIGDHVVLVSNHDQAQWDIGQARDDRLGAGVFARVGFDDVLPPDPIGQGPVPVFVDMDENGLPSDSGPSSPVLDVTEGYVRVHLLQGNSNDGLGGGRDPNGADFVLFEAYQVPEPSSMALSLLGLIGLLAARRRHR